MSCRNQDKKASDSADNFAHVLRHHIRGYEQMSKRERERAALEESGSWPRPNDKNQKKSKADKRRKKK